jgi:uncharacterized protein
MSATSVDQAPLSAPTDWLVAASLSPITDGELAPFYAAAARGELVMPFCGVCEWAALELEQTTCDSCGAQDVQWRTIELAGVVHSSTTVHRLEPGLVLTTEPYQIIDVEFASTHRLLMTTTRPTTDPYLIDTPVLIGFRTIGGIAVPAVSGLDTWVSDPLDVDFIAPGSSVASALGTVQLLESNVLNQPDLAGVATSSGSSLSASITSPTSVTTAAFTATSDNATTNSALRSVKPVTISSDDVPGGTR